MTSSISLQFQIRLQQLRARCGARTIGSVERIEPRFLVQVYLQFNFFKSYLKASAPFIRLYNFKVHLLDPLIYHIHSFSLFYRTLTYLGKNQKLRDVIHRRSLMKYLIFPGLQLGSTSVRTRPPRMRQRTTSRGSRSSPTWPTTQSSTFPGRS